MSALNILSDHECQELINYYDQFCKRETPLPVSIRNRCMVLLMLDAGFRVGEVVRTRRNALCFAGEFADSVVVTAEAAKGHRERTVPTTHRLKDAILLCHRYVWSTAGTGLDDFAFVVGSNKSHITTRQVQRIIYAASENSIGRRINPHVLRHTFATRLMARTNMRVVQELLGHKNITSTQIYTHPNHQDLKSAIQSLCENPVDKL